MTEHDTKTIAAQIPPLVFQAYPIDVLLRIYPDGAHYCAEILADGQQLRAPIGMSPADLASLNQQLHTAMRAIATAYSEDEELANRDELLHDLAETGNYAFKQVFCDKDAAGVICDLIKGERSISVQVVSESFFLPWELLYPESLTKPPSYDRFWGVQHIISRVVAQRRRPGAFVSPVISVPTLPALGLLTYTALESVVSKEIPFFERLATDGRISLWKLRALDPAKRTREIQEFKSFWTQSFHIGHFACHAFYRDDVPDQSRVVLSDEFEITLRDLEVYDIAIAGYPLIIMNACETGNLNPFYTSHFAGALLRHGARGVVATECAVPDDFAAEFAQVLYEHLLAGKPLGESLLTARRRFLAERGNPSGLLYSMYAPPSLRLARAG